MLTTCNWECFQRPHRAPIEFLGNAKHDLHISCPYDRKGVVVGINTHGAPVFD